MYMYTHIQMRNIFMHHCSGQETKWPDQAGTSLCIFDFCMLASRVFGASALVGHSAPEWFYQNH